MGDLNENQCGERIAKLEEWKETSNELLKELKADVRSLNRSMWVAVGVILAIQTALKFAPSAIAYLTPTI